MDYININSGNREGRSTTWHSTLGPTHAPWIGMGPHGRWFQLVDDYTGCTSALYHPCAPGQPVGWPSRQPRDGMDELYSLGSRWRLKSYQAHASDNLEIRCERRGDPGNAGGGGVISKTPRVRQPGRLWEETWLPVNTTINYSVTLLFITALCFWGSGPYARPFLSSLLKANRTSK